MRRIFVSLAFTLVAGIAVRAYVSPQQPVPPQQPPGRGAGPAPAPVADPVPTSAASIVLNPSAYLGRTVTITASVSRAVTATVFAVDQNRSTAQGEVLVIAPKLVTMPAKDAYVTVIGEAFAFDVADATARLNLKGGAKLDVPADVAAAFKGKPAIIATAIVASNMSDLTKVPPGPMTPDDVALSAIMKQVSPASAAIRTAITETNAAVVKTRVAELKKLFNDAQAVFKGKNIMTAMLWTADAMKAADAVDAAAAKGAWADATAASTTLSGACTSCHNAHRERMDDGTFRLKIGG